MEGEEACGERGECVGEEMGGRKRVGRGRQASETFLTHDFSVFLKRNEREMSAMKALLALVLCVSQANAAQPATKQLCAETKKSVSDTLFCCCEFCSK